MELMEMVSKVVSTVKGDKNMLSEFSVDPVKIVTKILGSGISADVIAKVVQEAAKQLGPLLGSDALKGIAGTAANLAKGAADSASDKAKDATDGGILGKIKNLF